MAGRDLVVGTPKGGVWVLNCFLGGCLSEVKGGYLFGFFLEFSKNFPKSRRFSKKFQKSGLLTLTCKVPLRLCGRLTPSCGCRLGWQGLGTACLTRGAGGSMTGPLSSKNSPQTSLHPSSNRSSPHPTWISQPRFSHQQGVLKEPHFFCEGLPLRTALRDRQPPTATNYQPPPTANRHQPPPIANRHVSLPSSLAQLYSRTADNHKSPPPHRDRPPPDQSDHRGKSEMYHWENLVRPFSGTQTFRISESPPPISSLLMLAWLCALPSLLNPC